MKRLNIIFSAFAALIIFFVSFINFDAGYNFSHLMPLLSETNGNEKVLIEFNAVTETLKEGIDFVKIIQEFYGNVNYDGYIVDRSFVNDDIFVEFYISSNSEEIISHLDLSGEVDFSKSYYITNDYSDINATIYVEQFNRFSGNPSSNFLKEKTVYKPISLLGDLELSDNNSIILMYFVVPETEVDNFKKYLEIEFVRPNYMCTETKFEDEFRICNMGFFMDTSSENYVNDKMNYNLLENPLEYPKSTVYLTMFSLILILLNITLTQSKEISIRHLYGNKEGVIFRRLFSQSIVVSILSFVATLVVVSVLALNFKLSVTHQFLSILTSFTIVYIVLMTLLSIVFYGLLKISLRSNSLKKTFKAGIIMYFSVLVKVVAIILLSFPIAQLFEQAVADREYLDYFDTHTFYQDHLIVRSINYGYEMNWEETMEQNQWLFSIIEDLELMYLNSMQLHQYVEAYNDQYFADETLKYVSVNRNLIKNYEMFDTENNKIDTESLEVNTIYVPESRLKEFDTHSNQFKNVVYTKDTPTVSRFATSGYVIESPIILVIVDDPSYHVDSINNDSIILPNDPETVKEFVGIVSNQITDPNMFRVNDLYSMISMNYRETMLSLVLSIFSTLIIITMFSYMITVTYIENFKMYIAIFYSQGFSRLKRYEGLIYIVLGTLISTFIVSDIQNRLANPLLGDRVNIAIFFGMIIIILIIDVILMITLINKFEAKSVPVILKGD